MTNILTGVVEMLDNIHEEMMNFRENMEITRKSPTEC
jgi:hypothetical protein